MLFVFVDAFEDVVHLLLEEEFELLDHELVDRALLHEGLYETVNGVSFVDYDPLQAVVGHIYVYK